MYLLFYFVFSVFGNCNYFFFAAHLIDVAVGVPALRIILQAITYNGKEYFDVFYGIVLQLSFIARLSDNIVSP